MHLLHLWWPQITSHLLKKLKCYLELPTKSISSASRTKTKGRMQNFHFFYTRNHFHMSLLACAKQTKQIHLVVTQVYSLLFVVFQQIQCRCFVVGSHELLEWNDYFGHVYIYQTEMINSLIYYCGEVFSNPIQKWDCYTYVTSRSLICIQPNLLRDSPLHPWLWKPTYQIWSKLHQPIPRFFLLPILRYDIFRCNFFIFLLHFVHFTFSN